MWCKSTTLWNFQVFRVVFSEQYTTVSSSRRVGLKKSGSRTPRVELEEMGPSLDLCLRRTKLASDDLYRRALRQPKTAKVNYFQQLFEAITNLLCQNCRYRQRAKV